MQLCTRKEKLKAKRPPYTFNAPFVSKFPFEKNVIPAMQNQISKALCTRSFEITTLFCQCHL